MLVRARPSANQQKRVGVGPGTKFKPGAFTALTAIEASSITDGRVSLKAAFGYDLNQYEFDAATGALYAVVAEIEARLAPRAHVDDPYAALVADVIQSMRHVGPDARVEHLAAMHHVAPRTLQRLFRRYVGVGPKWRAALAGCIPLQRRGNGRATT